MTSPFDDETSTFAVLVNNEDQHSLWPAHLGIPSGWNQVFQGPSRAECLQYIEQNWLDLRPKSLQEAMIQLPKGDI
jgi:uncharacterized protein YbdZ (MbtH family)